MRGGGESFERGDHLKGGEAFEGGESFEGRGGYRKSLLDSKSEKCELKIQNLNKEQRIKHRSKTKNKD